MGMSEYVRVVHQAVGPWEQGAILRKNRFDDSQLAHLEAAGAIEDVDADAEMPGGARLTLTETMQGGSYTLPNIPNTDVDPDMVRSKMGVPRETAAVTTAQTIQADAVASVAQVEGELSPSGKSHLQPDVAEALREEEQTNPAAEPTKKSG